MALPRWARLRRSVDVRRVLDHGRTRVGPLAAFFWMCRPGTAGKVRGPRIAVVASRRVGNAVQRNRVRRRLTEIVRTELPRLCPAADIVIVARRKSADAGFSALQREVSGWVTREKLRVDDKG